MSVQIDNNFWSTLKEHESLVKRCFNHIYYNKFPVQEGYESAYNYVLTKLYSDDIFSRFDASTVGKYRQTSDVAKTASKKFEQFVYKWITSFMSGLYRRERTEATRYVKFATEQVEQITESWYRSLRKDAGVSDWATEDDRKVAQRNYPSISYVREYNASESLSADDACYTKEFITSIKDALDSDRDRFIVESKVAERTNTWIGAKLGISSAQVGNILKSIRGRMVEFA